MPTRRVNPKDASKVPIGHAPWHTGQKIAPKMPEQPMAMVQGEELVLPDGSKLPIGDVSALVPKATVPVEIPPELRPKVVSVQVKTPTGRFAPEQAYGMQEYYELVHVSEDYIAAHEKMCKFMEEHDDPARSMLNRVSPNFIRSLVERRAPKS